MFWNGFNILVFSKHAGFSQNVSSLKILFIIYQISKNLACCSPEWNNATEGYSTSNEDKTATRLSEGTTRVLYSSDNSYRCGFPITFRMLDAGEKTPFDGIGLSANDEDTETLQRSNSIFVATSGNHL